MEETCSLPCFLKGGGIFSSFWKLSVVLFYFILFYFILFYFIFFPGALNISDD